jgi:hypothetical protein
VVTDAVGKKELFRSKLHRHSEIAKWWATVPEGDRNCYKNGGYGGPDAGDMARDECGRWLREHFPEWEDFNAYWDDEGGAETTGS